MQNVAVGEKLTVKTRLSAEYFAFTFYLMVILAKTDMDMESVRTQQHTDRSYKITTP